MEKSYGAWSRINDWLRSVTKVLPDCLWWSFSVKMIGGAAPGIWYIHLRQSIQNSIWKLCVRFRSGAGAPLIKILKSRVETCASVSAFTVQTLSANLVIFVSLLRIYYDWRKVTFRFHVRTRFYKWNALGFHINWFHGSSNINCVV